MITATRNWLRRNRTNLAIGAGLVGGVYLAGQYVLGKIADARRRMGEDASARENLQIRFRQNQEDCTYTVLALLPTASENIIKALPVEEILGELQARKTEKMTRSAANSEIAPSEIAPSEPATEEGSVGTSSFIHTSQQMISRSEVGEVSPQKKDTNGKSKVLLWEELKITSITRSITLLYTLPLLTLLTRIQLNLLGRRTYLSSVVALATPPPPANFQPQTDPFLESSPHISLENNDDDRTDYYGADLETNRKYLTFSWWLLHTGWASLKNEVEMAVTEVFGKLNPRDSLTFTQLAELILSVRKTVEGSTDDERLEKRWLGFLLPPRDQEEQVLRESGMLFSSASSPSSEEVPAPSPSAITPSLRRLLDETSDLIDSPTFSHVLTLLLDSAFSLLVEEKVATEAYKMPPLAVRNQPAMLTEDRVVDITDESPSYDAIAGPSIKLATIMAVFTRQAHAIGRGGEESIHAIESASMGSIGLAGGLPKTSVTGQIGGLASANEYLAALSSVRDLEAFAAVVYSSNFEFEGLNEDDGSLVVATPAETQLALDNADIDASLVDVGADPSLESAWGKATEKV